jgi:hypothetical protein
MSITAMFEQLGAPLANPRWSWGGVRQDGSVMLRVWQNETKRIDGRTHVQLTHYAEFVGREDNYGYQERLRHVNQIQTGVRCYMVMCEAKEPKAVPRKIKDFDKDVLVAGALIEHEGDLWVPITGRQTAASL